MKKINIVAGLLAGLLSFTSCSDYLDRTPDDQTTEQQVFTRFDKVESLVTDLYARAKYSLHPLIYFSHFSLSSISDECSASSHEGAIPHQFHVGNYGPSQGMPGSAGQYWDDIYYAIRNANIILEGVKKYNTPDNPQDGREGDLRRRMGEVYFLRGYLHLQLIRSYGEAVYMDRVIYPGDDMTFEKESFHSMVEKICADADSAYARVDAWNGGQYFGRVDKGACLGLKAMARWLAATPMWNGGTLPNDTRVFKDEYGYDPKRWELARDAAKAVLECKKTDGSLRYKLYETYDKDDFRDIDGNAETNNHKVQQRLWQMMYDMNAIQDEWVWFVTRDKDTGWSGDVLPPSQGGHARQRPLQEQVDEYEYIGPDGYGYPIYCDHAAKDGYDDANPYEGIQRDPRFYRDIRYHGSWYGGTQLNTAEGNDAVSGSYLDQASHTGYYLRKFYKDGWDRGHG
ncbi:MAG: RagB/SusD family nutrient uptake outer membrane protein, partial [Parabacteroides sp.]|nr:RagB/SusD family nutrient uptake outer membrane protein [Parabacteroides sp.]